MDRIVLIQAHRHHAWWRVGNALLTWLTVQINARKEHEHHEDQAIVLDFNAIFFRTFGDDREIECFELLETECQRPNPVRNVVRNNYVTMLYRNSFIG